ncbi:MAG: NAD(P)H-dependent oxidoreductase [Epsilonproteobacteria bacterium]|nr:NAD(P)H-dependent oxidoreductase [Campylobacterota bacterium]
MNIYALLAHHKKDSLCGHLYKELVTDLERRGHNVDSLYLYEHAADIPFWIPSKPQTEREQAQLAFFEQNKQRIMQADGLLIVFPIYWYSVPGILKCWIDLISTYAWEIPQRGARKANPRHSIKNAQFVSIADLPNWYLRLFTGNTAQRQLRETFKFMGVQNIAHYQIGSVHTLNTDRVDKHVSKLVTQSQKLFG